MSKVCVKQSRFHLCSAILVCGFLLLCGRLYVLQVIKADSITAEYLTPRKRVYDIEAKRGDILDRRGNLLAGTRRTYRLGVDPQFYEPGQEKKMALLAEMLDMPLDDLLERAERRYREDRDGVRRRVQWVPFKDVDEDLYTAVQALGIEGVYGNAHYERYYPGRGMAAHLIGYLNKENVAVMGVERALDYYLRGQSGWRETEVDGRDNELAAFQNREVPARDGLPVQLTIDIFVQSVVETALEELVREMAPAGASIIVSDPASGEILGLANYPTFDPNTFWAFPIENQRNRALTDQYEPGSTFKVVPIAAALEEGLIGPDTIINCGIERVLYNGVDIRLPSDHRNLGPVTVRTVVTKSSNRGAAQIGMLLGEERLYDYARRFGFGEGVEWPLPGEATGQLPAVDDWDGLTISRLPTGYAVGATPMQVHLAMATIANEGVRLRPKLLKQVLNPEGEGVLPLNPEKGDRILSRDTARAMQEMLVNVVGPEGTARRAALTGYAVAGKTGTSRKIINGQYTTNHHVGSFSGFFPAHRPRVVITIVVDDAQVDGPAYGGVVAAPLFRSIGEKLIPHLAIRKPEKWEPFLVSNDGS